MKPSVAEAQVDRTVVDGQPIHVRRDQASLDGGVTRGAPARAIEHRGLDVHADPAQVLAGAQAAHRHPAATGDIEDGSAVGHLSIAPRLR